MDTKAFDLELQKIAAHTREIFQTIRTGRASPALVEHILVEYYGTRTPLKQLASIGTPDPKTITIQPWDSASAKDIERGIQQSDLGIMPTVDGTLIRISLPPMTEERRLERLKIVRSRAEEARVRSRQARDAAMKRLRDLEREKILSEDARALKEKEIDKMMDAFLEEIKRVTEGKEKELMTL